MEDVVDQHKLVTMDIEVKTKREPPKEKIKRIKIWLLLKEDMKKKFKDEVRKQREANDKATNVNTSWLQIKNIILSSAEEILGRTSGRVKRNKETWWC